MAAACGASGYFFVNYVFQTSMERETRQALDESSILRFAFETAALNIPSKYDVLPDGTVEQIGVYLENSGQHGNRLLRISDENGKVLYVSEGFTGDTSLWEERGENTRVYRGVQSGDSYYIQTQTRINVSDRLLTLETMKNVTAVYTERTEGFRMYRIEDQRENHRPESSVQSTCAGGKTSRRLRRCPYDAFDRPLRHSPGQSENRQ